MKTPRPAILLTCCALAFLLTRCSFNIAGGTETGNPQALACARAAFDAMDAAAGWCPLSHVPGGPSRLDPQSISLAAPTYGIAKTAAAPPVAADTMYVYRPTLVRDTLLRPETTYVKDTIRRVRTVDTLRANDSVSLVFTVRVTDSVVVMDTLVGMDTVIFLDTVLVRDTLYPGDTIAGKPDSSIYGDSAKSIFENGTGANTASIHILRGNILSDVALTDSGPRYEFLRPDAVTAMQTYSAPVPVANYFTTSLSALASVEKRWAGAAGAVVTERYSDLDGDSLLLSAAAGSTPRALYAVAMSGARGSRTVFCDFDAGADRTMGSTTDNRLLRLSRTTVCADSTQTIAYNWKPALPSGSDSLLTVASFRNRGEAESLTVAFSISRGADPASWDDDRLGSISVVKVFRSGTVARLDMVLTPASPVGRDQTPAAASVSATVRMVDGTVYTVSDGAVDLGRGEFGAMFGRDGTPSRLDVRRSDLP